MIRRLSLLLLVLAACDGKAPPAPEPPPPDLPRLPDLEPPVLEETDPGAAEEAPSEAPALRWSFARGTTHAYTVRQEMTLRASSTPVGVDPVHVGHVVRAEGQMAVEGRGEEGGRVRFRLAKTLWTIDGRAVSAEEMKKDPPTAFEADLAPDGAMSRLNRITGEAPDLLGLFLLLPAADLAPQAVESEPTLKSQGFRGTLRTRPAGWRRIGPRSCIRLESDVDVELLLPAGTRGRGRIRATLIRHFDPAGGRLLRLDAAITGALRSLVRGPRAAGGPPVWGIAAQDYRGRVSFRLVD